MASTLRRNNTNRSNSHPLRRKTKKKKDSERRTKKKDKKGKQKKSKDRKKKSKEPSPSAAESSESQQETEDQDKRKKAKKKPKKKKTKESSLSSEESSSSGSSRSRETVRNKKRKRDTSTSSSSSRSSSSSSGSSDSDESAAAAAIRATMSSKEWKKHKAMCKARFRAINRSWPREQRPSFMQTWLDCGDYTVLEMLAMKTQVSEEDQKRNLGQDIFMRDSKPRKKKFKAQTDNGKTKLHQARFLRPPLCPPKDYYGQIPRKRNEIIRNFPMDHYGVQGQVSDTTIGKLHNRASLLTYEAFGKTSFHPGKSGKYADRHQLEEALMNYGTMMNAMWQYDYSNFVIWRVIHEAKWGEAVTTDEKKRSELVIEFFNAILAENCARAVNDKEPCDFDQVTEPY